MELKGVSVYDLYVVSGFKRSVYNAFELNKFTKEFLKFVGEQIGEDLSMYVNAKYLK